MSWINLKKEDTSINTSNTLIDNLPDPVVATNLDLEMEFLNVAAVNLFQLTNDEAEGKPFHNLVFSGKTCPVFSKIKEKITPGSSWKGDIVLRSNAGKALLTKLASTPIFNRKNKLEGYLFQVKEVQKQTVKLDLEQHNDVLYKELFSNMGNGVAIYESVSNGNNFKFVDINKAGCKIGNHKSEDAIGELITDIYPEVKNFGLFDTIREVWETGTPQFLPLKAYTDKRLNLWIENYVFKLPTGQIVCVYNDHTEKRKAEEAVTQNKNFYETILEEVKEIICVSDREGSIKFMNSRAREFFNFDSNPLGLNLLSDFPENIISKLLPYYKSSQESLSPVQFETEFSIDPGKPMHVSCWFIPQIHHDEFDGMICSMQNITEKVVTQNILIENEEKLHGITSSANDAIIVVNENAEITFWNNSAERIFEKENQEVSGADFLAFFKEAESLDTLRTILRSKDTDRVISSLDISGIKKSGDIVPLELSVSPMTLNGKINHVAILRDITRRKKTEQELINAKLKAEESDNLKTAFLANLSHEIRTPMNAIIGLSDMIGDNTIEQEERIDYISMIQSNSKQLLKIIEDLIDVSKLGSGEIVLNNDQFNLNKAISDCLLDIEDSKVINHRTKLTANLPVGKNPIVKADKARLQQVLNILIENASKFTPSGTIEVGYEFGSVKDKDVIKLFVKDSGIGIAKENHESIFEYFRQVDGSNTRQAGGTGVGLSIAKGLLELANEQIWVESSLNQGACFYFTVSAFEMEEKPVEQVVKKPENNDFPDWNDQKLLIVEDVDSNFMFLRKALQKTGIEIIWAQNGLEAVERFKSNEKFDIILMDINLPLMNGYEATAEIRKINPEIPIIAQTAFVSKEEELRCLNEGFTDYIPKPIRRNLLIEKMKTSLKNFQA